MSKLQTRIRIALDSEERRRHLLELDVKLAEQGVVFDTGYWLQEGVREWDLTQLEGPPSVEEVVQCLRNGGFKTEATQEVPREVADVYRRLKSKEIDASDAVAALKALIREQEPAVLIRP